MEQKRITEEAIQAFRQYLTRDEKSAVTVEKYLRDVRAFQAFIGETPVEKELVIHYKNHLLEESYAVRSINSMLASVNSFLIFVDWPDCKVKSLKVQRQVYCAEEKEDQLIELVNPEIIYTEGEQTGLEGCLSVPGKYGEVTRPYIVRVRAQDRDGNWFEAEDEGLTARCFCHEIEHLDGHLFVEHTDRLLEGEELQKWLDDHADEYEIEETEEEDT